MFDAINQETHENNSNEASVKQREDENKPLSSRKKFLSHVFNRHVGDFLIGAGMSAGVSTGTKLGAAALIGMTGAPVIVTAVGVAVAGGIASGAVRHAWNWHKDHQGMENAPSFWSAESGKKAFKSVLMSGVFAGTGGALFSTLNHFYGDEIGAFVSKSASWLGLPSPAVMMDRAREAVADTRVFKTAVAAGRNLTSSMEAIQIPSTGTLMEKTKGFFSNLLTGAKILAGAELPLSSTPPAVLISTPLLPSVAGAAPVFAMPAFPENSTPSMSYVPLQNLVPPLPDVVPIVEPSALVSTEAIQRAALPVYPKLPLTIQPRSWLIDLPEYFDAPASVQMQPMPRPFEDAIRPMPRPAVEDVVRPLPRPVAQGYDTAPPVAKLLPDMSSFKLASNSPAFSFDQAADGSSFILDPKSIAPQYAALSLFGADTIHGLEFSGPIVPDTKSLIELTMAPGMTHLPMPGEDILKERLQEAMDGRAVRASTRALIDVAFGPADTVQEAADKAQAMKDLAFRALNGQGGIPMNSDLGLALMQSAAAADNMQAKVDLAYIAYHGLHGVQASPSQALAQMNVLAEHSIAARDFASEWTHGSHGAAKGAAAVAKAAGAPLECAWQIDKGGQLSGGTCRGSGVRNFNVGDTVFVPVLKI